MKQTKPQLSTRRPRAAANPAMYLFVLLALGGIGCNGLQTASSTATSTATSTSATAAPAGLQTYMAVLPLSTYTIDDTTAPGTFSQTTTSLVDQQGTEVHQAGTFTVLARGLRNLGTTYSLPIGLGTVTTPNPLQAVGYAVELAGQAGGLVQPYGQAVTPIVAATACPNFPTAQTFQFLTLPNALDNTFAVEPLTWDPAQETAYGSVSISTSGSTVTLSNIQQFTVPMLNGGSQPPINPAPTAESGACSPTPYGNTVSVPGSLTIAKPGNGSPAPATATFAIGPSGLLLENSGSGPSPTYYDNVLGAGTGAIGMPQPTSPVDTAAVVGAQYLGFIYGSGVYNPDGVVTTSTVASFGFPSLPSGCASIAPPTSTLIYGGDFPANNPASAAVQANGGYGNCDFAVDLGTQSAANNGLYPGATIWIGNTANKPYSIPAVAIAGQLNGKYAIFVLGVDTIGTPNQPWSIYLMQSN